MRVLPIQQDEIQSTHTTPRGHEDPEQPPVEVQEKINQEIVVERVPLVRDVDLERLRAPGAVDRFVQLV